MPKPKKPKTHFEQVPVEIVKKIAAEDIPDDEGNGNDAVEAEDTPIDAVARSICTNTFKKRAEKEGRYGKHAKKLATRARLGERSVS